MSSEKNAYVEGLRDGTKATLCRVVNIINIMAGERYGQEPSQPIGGLDSRTLLVLRDLVRASAAEPVHPMWREGGAE